MGGEGMGCEQCDFGFEGCEKGSKVVVRGGRSFVLVREINVVSPGGKGACGVARDRGALDEDGGGDKGKFRGGGG